MEDSTVAISLQPSQYLGILLKEKRIVIIRRRDCFLASPTCWAPRNDLTALPFISFSGKSVIDYNYYISWLPNQLPLLTGSQERKQCSLGIMWMEIQNFSFLEPTQAVGALQCESCWLSSRGTAQQLWSTQHWRWNPSSQFPSMFSLCCSFFPLFRQLREINSSTFWISWTASSAPGRIIPYRIPKPIPNYSFEKNSFLSLPRAHGFPWSGFFCSNCFVTSPINSNETRTIGFVTRNWSTCPITSLFRELIYLRSFCFVSMHGHEFLVLYKKKKLFH